METSKENNTNGHIGTIEDQIEDSLLEIEWIIRKRSHIIDLVNFKNVFWTFPGHSNVN